MSPLASIILLTLIAAGSLTLVSVLDRKQKEQKAIKRKIATLRRDADECLELVETAAQMVRPLTVAQLILKQAIELLQEIESLDPTAKWIQNQLENATERLSELELEDAGSTPQYAASNDDELAHLKQQLNQIGRFLRKSPASKSLGTNEQNQFMHELRWSYLQLDVRTLIEHGYKANQIGDILSASTFFRKALMQLQKSSINDERKQRQLKEVTQLANGALQVLPEDVAIWGDGLEQDKLAVATGLANSQTSSQAAPEPLAEAVAAK